MVFLVVMEFLVKMVVQVGVAILVCKDQLDLQGQTETQEMVEVVVKMAILERGGHLETLDSLETLELQEKRDHLGLLGLQVTKVQKVLREIRDARAKLDLQE